MPPVRAAEAPDEVEHGAVSVSFEADAALAAHLVAQVANDLIDGLPLSRPLAAFCRSRTN
jgi:hypothetical protein